MRFKMILPWAICTPRVALGVGMSLPGSLQSDHTCLWAGRTGGAPRRGQPMHPVRSQCPSAIVKWAHGKASLLPEHCHSGLSREMRDRIPIPQSRGEWGKHCNFWDWGVRKETWHERRVGMPAHGSEMGLSLALEVEIKGIIEAFRL